LGMENAMKAGVGSCAVRTDDGITVGALAVVNNLGDVLAWESGEILAGARDPATGRFADTARTLMRLPDFTGPPAAAVSENTNLIVAATDAKLDKAGACQLARMASAGMARVLSPAHSTFDGDIVFAFSTGDKPGEVNRLGAIAAEMVAIAINRGVLEADGLGVVPAVRDFAARR